ncbi:MAG TPA: DUF2249 domain-containing protein, partial [Anaeromyxobacteraceae bacterium]|nr:DUF2249 domain-containing protein [Anaeromyxobacteraceae bacterium]
FASGAVTAAYDLFTLELRAIDDDDVEVAAPRVTEGRWSKGMTTFEMGAWIGATWLFGALVTLGLLSFNLHTVRMGDPTIPYTLATIGYPGLLVTTVAFAVRFLRAFEARQAALSRLSFATTPAPLVDVRDRPVPQREPIVIQAYEALTLGRAFVLVSDRDPGKILEHVRHDGADFATTYLEEGPDVWRVQVGRLGLARDRESTPCRRRSSDQHCV